MRARGLLLGSGRQARRLRGRGDLLDQTSVERAGQLLEELPPRGGQLVIVAQVAVVCRRRLGHDLSGRVRHRRVLGDRHDRRRDGLLGLGPPWRALGWRRRPRRRQEAEPPGLRRVLGGRVLHAPGRGLCVLDRPVLRVLGGRIRRRGRDMAAEDIEMPGCDGGRRRRHGSSRLARRPVDGVEIEPGGVIDLDAPIFEAVHGREGEQPDLSEERFGQPLGDEHDARRPAVSAIPRRHQTPDGLRILECPRVGLDHPEERRVVACEAERDEGRRVVAIQADELDRRAAEVGGGGEDAESSLHCLSVLSNELLQLGQVLDFVLSECQLHPDTSRATGVPVVKVYSGLLNQWVKARRTVREPSWDGQSGTRELDGCHRARRQVAARNWPVSRAIKI